MQNPADRVYESNALCWLKVALLNSPLHDSVLWLTEKEQTKQAMEQE